jgi:hypothetical protein
MHITKLKLVWLLALTGAGGLSAQESARPGYTPNGHKLLLPVPPPAQQIGVPEKTILPIVDDRPAVSPAASLSFDGRPFSFRVEKQAGGATLVRDDAADPLDPQVLRAYPDGSRALLRWVMPAGYRVRASLMSDEHHHLSSAALVDSALESGGAALTLTRGSWASAGPMYLEFQAWAPGSPHAFQWRSDLFLLIRWEDGDDALARAARHYAEHWPKLSTMATLPSGQPPATVAGYTRNMTIGSTGADVAMLQSYLESKGFMVMPAGVPKGKFGKIERAALAHWQKSVGIVPAEGYFGPISRARMNADLSTSTR